MKKAHLPIAAMTLSLIFLASHALGSRVRAQDEGFVIEGDNLTCKSLSGCCGAAGCEGPGKVNGCKIECTGGGSITCAVVVGGVCQ